MSEIIPLANGKTVTLDEFLTWSAVKQAANMREFTITDERRAEISAQFKGRVAPNKGKPLSLETKAKLSAAKKGRKKTDEHKKALGAAKKGKPRSEETRAKLSATNSTPLMTPIGLFPSCKAAATAYRVAIATLRKWRKVRPTEFFYVAKLK